jgi:hypothetical protein
MENFCPAHIPDKIWSLSHADFFWFFLDYFHFRPVLVFAATPQRHRQAGNLEVPPAAFISGRSYLQAAEKLPEINLHKKMAASGMEHALRTFYVHAAAPASGGNGRAVCCKHRPPAALALTSPFRADCLSAADGVFFGAFAPASPQAPEERLEIGQ